MRLLGAGFLDGSAGQPTVLFGGVPATGVEVESDSSVLCVLPSSAPGPVDVFLSNANGSASLVDGFAYLRALRLTDLSPTSGKSAGKTLVTLFGSGFGTPVTPRVFFGAAEAQNVSVLEDDTLTCDTPGAQPGDVVDVRVSSALGTSVLKLAFQYVNGSASVVGSEPDAGDPEEWTPVVLSGSGFTSLDESELSVSFGERLASDARVVDDGTITCLAPPGTAGLETDLVVADAEDTARLQAGWRWASGAAQDLDDDGWSDLLTRLADGRLVVRFGRGHVELDPPVELAGVPAGPLLPVVADATGDGIPDLLEVREAERARSTSVQDGRGSRGSSTSISTVGSTCSCPCGTWPPGPASSGSSPAGPRPPKHPRARCSPFPRPGGRGRTCPSRRATSTGTDAPTCSSGIRGRGPVPCTCSSLPIPGTTARAVPPVRSSSTTRPSSPRGPSCRSPDGS